MNNINYQYNLKKYFNELIQLYCLCFDTNKIDAEHDFLNYINMKKSCAIIINEKVVSFVGVSIKKIIIGNKKQKIMLLGAIMTHPDHRGKGYSKLLIDKIVNKFKNKYYSIVIQTKHWNIYKKVDLINPIIKAQVKLNKDIQTKLKSDLNFVPTYKVIKNIEKSKNQEYTSLIRTRKQINNNIKLAYNQKLIFISNQYAYVWYDSQQKIIDSMFYSDFKCLVQILKYLEYDKDILVFKTKELEKYKTFFEFKKDVITTYTLKLSNHTINNLNIIDYEL